MTTTPIDTARLRLDPITTDDVDALFPVLDDPRLHTYIGGSPMNRDALAKWIEFVTPGHSPNGDEIWCNWVVRRREDGQVIGTAQAAALAWWAKAHGMVWLRAAIHPEHEASAAVAGSIGMAPTPETLDGEVVWRGLPPAI